jgi:tight adherence protein C
MDVIVIQLLSFSSVMLFVLGLHAVIYGEKKTAAGSKPAVFKMFTNEISAVGSFLAPGTARMAPRQTLQIRNDLIAAALPLEVFEVRGLQGLAAVTLAVLSGVIVFIVTMKPLYALLALAFFAFMGWVYPVIWVSGAARRRKDAMSKSLPYAIDLITVAMQAGQDFGAAVRHLVTQGLRGPLAQEFAIMLRQTELGKSRIEALRDMSERIQLDEFRTLVTSVAQSTEMGASISETMKIQAEEIRRARYHKAERKAARAPSLMLIPMALFILPAVFIVIFTPVVIRVMESGIVEYFPKIGG